MEEHLYPDIEWYTKYSENKAVSPRCPFASVHRCPRYFQGISLFGQEGILSKLDPTLDKKIGDKWEATDIWPAVRHEYSGIMSSDKKQFIYRDFCPEITGEAFGLFASTLTRYSDETDKEVAHNFLVNQGRSLAKDWRWEWSGVDEMHYTHCPLYSLLAVSLKPIDIVEKEEPIFSAKPGAFGFSIDLKQILTRAARWWLAKQK